MQTNRKELIMSSLHSVHSEHWKPVALEFWCDFYEVSSLGRVRNRRNGKILTQKPSGKRNYVGITLKAEGKKKCTYVHILVTRTFKGPPPTDKHECCHRNGSGDDNRATNLYWGTRKDNFKDMVRHGRTFPRKLTNDQVRQIKRRLGRGDKCYSIARDYGVHANTIVNIDTGKSYSDV